MRLTVGLTLASSGIIPEVHTDHRRRKELVVHRACLLRHRLASAALAQRGWYLIESRLLSQGAGRKLMSICRAFCCAHFRVRELLLWYPRKTCLGRFAAPARDADFDVIAMTKTKVLPRQSAGIERLK